MMTRYRFAPSPTGHLHIGGARTALYNYLMAQRTGGQFILRIEDTDRERSTQGFIDSILEAMAWLGLDYEEGPFYQTQRGELYREHLERLLRERKAYRCFCTPEEIQAKREAAMKAGLKPKYDGTCRKLNPEQSERDPRPHCIRFISPDEGVTAFQDLIKGPVQFDNKELDDLIIARSDGTPTYNFVVVIDDLTMKITHVIRGDDHLNNTPRQIQLYQAFDYPVPVFAHVPMILGADKKRLSKRHGATSVLAYRDQGYLPEALLNYLVRLGWASGDEEIFSLDRLKEVFDITKVGKAAAVFNPEKLLWLNGYWIRNSTPERLLQATLPFLEKAGLVVEDESYAQRALATCREKVKTLKELAEMAAFYFQDEISMDEKTRAKCLKGNYREILGKALNALKSSGAKEPGEVEAAIKKLAETEGLKLGEVAQPLRAVLTGSMVSPGIFDLISVLGRERVEGRVQRALARHS